MHPIIDDLLVHKESIVAMYLIGSSQTENHQIDSDIDIVVLANKIIDLKFITVVRNKYKNIDLVVLDYNCVKSKISKSPSIYISAINQITLNPRILYGINCINDFKLSQNKVIHNQLHFPYFMLNKLNLTYLIDKELVCRESFLKTTLSQRFIYNDLNFYSYRALKTLMLTLCSYKLISYKKFDLTKHGKHWFINDYLNFCIEDKHYHFIKSYFTFTEKYQTSVFDAPVSYFENKLFKESLLNILMEYKQYFHSIHDVSFYNKLQLNTNVKKEIKTLIS